MTIFVLLLAGVMSLQTSASLTASETTGPSLNLAAQELAATIDTARLRGSVSILAAAEDIQAITKKLAVRQEQWRPYFARGEGWDVAMKLSAFMYGLRQKLADGKLIPNNPFRRAVAAYNAVIDSLIDDANAYRLERSKMQTTKEDAKVALTQGYNFN